MTTVIYCSSGKLRKNARTLKIKYAHASPIFFVATFPNRNASTIGIHASHVFSYPAFFASDCNPIALNI